jgi:acetyl-CoA C-acetyltransferase
MESIKDKVAIVGMGCTKFGENWEKSAEDMLVDSAVEACQDASIDIKDVQAVWFGSTRINTAEPCATALKLEYIPVTRVENLCATATEALRNACFGIASGVYDVVMAIGVEKLKDQGMGGLGTVTGAGGDGTMEWGMSAAMFFARMATRYMAHYNMTYEELKQILAKISVKNHHNGSLNPRAHFQREITEEQAINAPMGYLQPSYDMVHMEETVRAARQAYDMAGIKDPFNEIDLAEVHDCFSITELVIMEDLGFCPRGKASEYVRAGTFKLDGRLAVNPDGGLKSFGHPIGASGLRMIYEIYKQMQGKAGPRQRKNPRLGLTHNFGMNPGSGIGSVTILGQRD